jgi:hypothetical protein
MIFNYWSLTVRNKKYIIKKENKNKINLIKKLWNNMDFRGIIKTTQ